ncbi:histidine phosphatase family protein [Streptomyces millisiae]|uniref:Histidine phosphatase family protein n=1 Tax=Streptomyces millisiae TaxID=3075542 RepID=A0ABU2LZU3_9ACTN|nr:histidine phosphatase family protein [Streptomyces sp. DSM 44918]MDT0323060.1 histidine phosphatase family protein [Streptomyces sp. DSM 44918]
MSPVELVVHADGGSRGNPGPAGYGAVVADAETGEVLAETAEFIGRATNNVAEYRGLIAGLRAAHAIDPQARVRVRMDSKLVVEQMSGRWQIKHPDMRPLAAEARAVFQPGAVSYEWIPRERNKHADRLANEAMDRGTPADTPAGFAARRDLGPGRPESAADGGAAPRPPEAAAGRSAADAGPAASGPAGRSAGDADGGAAPCLPEAAAGRSAAGGQSGADVGTGPAGRAASGGAEGARPEAPADAGPAASGPAGRPAAGDAEGEASPRPPEDVASAAASPVGPAQPGAGGPRAVAAPGWGRAAGVATTFLLLRHGETPLTPQKRFSGTGGDPELSETGHRQAEAAARALAEAGGVEAVVSSPLARCLQTAELVARRLDLPVRTDDALRETDFGAWEGLTFAEVQQRHPADLAAWLRDPDARPTDGGESFTAVARRVAAARDRIIARHAGRTVLVVSHVTPIKSLLRLALDAPPIAMFRMELSAAALSEVAYYPDGNASVRRFNDTGHLGAVPAR